SGWWDYLNLHGQLGDGGSSALFGVFTEHGQAAATVIGAVFSVMNVLALAFLVVLFVYVMGVGILGTAHEGQPLGKRYSTLWTPIRSGLAVMLLVPLPWAKGLSFLQALLLMFVYYGIGAANTVTDAAMTYLEKNQGLSAPNFQPVGGVSDVVDNTVQSILTLKMYIKDNYGDGRRPEAGRYSAHWEPILEKPGFFGRIYNSVTHSEPPPVSPPAGPAAYRIGRVPGVCTGKVGKGKCVIRYAYQYATLEKNQTSDKAFGGAEIACADAAGPACARRLQAFADMQKKAEEIADFLARDVGDIEAYQGNGPQRGSVKIAQEILLRMAADNLAESNRKANDPGNRTNELSAEAELIRSQGWAMLGSWYNRLAEHDRKTLPTSDSALSIKTFPVQFSEARRAFFAPQAYQERLNAYQMYKRTGGNRKSSVANATSCTAYPVNEYGLDESVIDPCAENRVSEELEDYLDISSPEGLSTRATEILTQSLSYGPDSWASYLSDGDPVRNLQILGTKYVDGVQAAAAAFFALKVAGHFVGGATEGGLLGSILSIFTGKGISRGIEAATNINDSFLGRLIAGAMTGLFVTGMALAYYLPMVPFFLWVMGFIGWVILVMEVMVAAPLWAIAHGIPDGEGMAGQHGKQGYMLFLRVLARPSLMVIGFFISILLFEAIAGVLGAGLRMAQFDAQGGSSWNFSWSPAYVVSYGILMGVLVITVAHRTFALITWIPDNVLNWIAQLHTNLGEGQDEHKIEGGARAGYQIAGATGGAMIAGGGSSGRRDTPSPSTIGDEADAPKGSLAARTDNADQQEGAEKTANQGTSSDDDDAGGGTRHDGAFSDGSGANTQHGAGAGA
ncbi:DotA/TraY family protein, partial [Thiolapillus sp.]